MSEILILLTAIIFYFLGRYSTGNKTEQIIDKITKQDIPAIIIKRPSQKDIIKRQNKLAKETEQEMENLIEESINEKA